MNRIRSFFVIAFLGACFTSFAQNDVKNKFNPINTGVTSLGIARMLEAVYGRLGSCYRS